jgi:hypothetical protein
MKHSRVSDEAIAEIQKAAPGAFRQDIGAPPGREDEIGTASTVIDRDMVWAPFSLESGDLALLEEGEPIWFAQVGLPIRPFTGAIDPWGIRRFGLRKTEDEPTTEAQRLRALLDEAFEYVEGSYLTTQRPHTFELMERIGEALGLDREDEE